MPNRISTSASALLLLAGAVSGPFDGDRLAAAQAVTFEVASVKSNTSGDARLSIGTRGRTYTAMNAPLRRLILQAHDLSFEGFRLIGGPEWIRSDRFDVTATLPENARPGQTALMLRALLVERFKLVTHTETRDLPIYALVLARNDGKLGAGLRRAAVDCDAMVAAGTPVPPAEPGELPVCGSQIDDSIRGRGQTMAALGRMMAQFVDRRIVDRTGLAGGFDFEIRFSERETATRPDGAAGDLPSLFTALQEQLGLKLESARGPVEVVVIDSVEKPSEN